MEEHPPPPPERSRISAGLVVAIVLGAVALAIVIVVFARRGDASPELEGVNEVARGVGCSTVQVVPDQGRAHVTPPQRVRYATDPPTSGEHYPQWVATGVHRGPIQAEQQVHNLEHGHVGIQYQPTIARAVRERLEAFTRANDRWVFMAPRPDMSAQLAFTSWNHLLRCSTTGDDADDYARLAQAFFDALGDRSPHESIPGLPAGSD